MFTRPKSVSPFWNYDGFFRESPFKKLSKSQPNFPNSFAVPVRVVSLGDKISWNFIAVLVGMTLLSIEKDNTLSVKHVLVFMTNLSYV